MNWLVFIIPLTLIGCVSPKAKTFSIMASDNAIMPTHILTWIASPDSDVFYEVQHSPKLDAFSLFAYTGDTQVATDSSLDADFFIVRAVRNNGFHSSETSDWATK